MLSKHYLEQGVSKAELSRRFGISRRKQELDPYKPIIDTRREEFARPSAQRLFDGVRAAGYAGGYGRVRDS